ncbi:MULTISPECIES: hypothetical protein [unclassified Streptomyces]|uniref:hypothetical protein n=1 Tax=unclassified Streptomyces TaxID=2593676 RepID=UPI0003760F6C|nr:MULTISPECIES: hypothetical protein [unclassified Streptomyces]MYS33728.1 hypothetical protein [Streptomyces sp. SID4920]MYX64179.1 hypothetical protein [Streptomyces sp. SID8373]
MSAPSSVAAAREGRSEGGEDATVHEIRPRKEGLAKKPAAKKTTTPKTTSKKTAASKAGKKRSAS